jgi:8-oxo-dGTP pyrophosphatase MutT (NUDIX family)
MGDFVEREILMRANKACPVLLSATCPPRLLLFRHPLAGVQLVKGSLEHGESPGQAALRELAEESGIVAARIVADLGCWEAGHQGQVWSFQLCQASTALPEHWSHQTTDDHGHVFRFFWAALDDLPVADCHPLFQRALAALRERLQGFRSTLWELQPRTPRRLLRGGSAPR